MSVQRVFSHSAVIAGIILIFLISNGCGKKKNAGPGTPEYNAAISAFTSGTVSSKASVKVILNKEQAEAVSYTEPISQDLFNFSPSVKGNAYWIDKRTIEFKPEKQFKPGTLYTVKFYVGKIRELPADKKIFTFQFNIIKQSLSLEISDFKSYDEDELRWNRLNGVLLTADVAESGEIKKVLTATQDGRNLHVTWTQEPDLRTNNFSIDSIERKENAGTVLLEWNGNPIGSAEKGKKEVTIPSLSDFLLMDVRVVQQPEQYLQLQFSDPLLRNQNLAGLIKLANDVELNFVIDHNLVRAYPASRQQGHIKIYVEPGIKNVLGYRFKTEEVHDIAFEEVKPAVRLTGNGVILPDSKGLIFPFEAVNLKAVDVRIIKIYENNIAQFLQVNNLDGERELKRTGRLILKKKIDLAANGAVDLGKWNTFSLDLADLIKTDPGAIYRVVLGFKRSYSVYPCDGEESTVNETEQARDEEELQDEMSYWDTYDYYSEYDYQGYYSEDYNWKDRDNPCTPSYYGTRRNVARNILASNLGIIAKGGTNHSMLFAVTDLRTTEPLENVQLELYNYQQQLIGAVKTGKNGLAEISIDKEPFLLIAKKDKQRGYLRLDDGSSLSLSNFDVAGQVVQKGLKGYIYGERGVWRPGDTLFISFILEDEQDLLPENHPVTFELTNPLGQLVKTITRAEPSDGFYNFTTATSPDAPTGNWQAAIHVGGTTFSKTLKIETVKPNRLKIDFDLGTDRLIKGRFPVNATLKTAWLHGAVARNLKAKVAVTLSQGHTSFKNDAYNGYIFDDPARSFSSEEQTIFDGKVNVEGQAVVPVNLSVNDAAPGMLNASFVVRVFEESGDFSIDRFTVPFAPYKSFVGIKAPEGNPRTGMLVTDTAHRVNIVTVDAEGNPVSRSNLTVRIYKVGWRWWWDASEDNLASYVAGNYNDLVVSKKISTSNGKGSFTFRIDYPKWGRYLIRVTDPVSGHTTGTTVYVDWPSWEGRDQREIPGGAAMLVFSADKKKYEAGETAKVSFPSEANGRALVSIESGSRVIDAYWVETSKGETAFNFKVTEEMAPNIYVHITLLQPHSQTANDLPIRLYGVIPLLVEDPGTRLYPEIEMPDVLKPEQDVTVKVSEKNGRGMTYTLAIVDDGLLDLTRFRTPDPWNSFYAREALGVKTWDLYNLVLGAYGGKIEQLFSIGGDDELLGTAAKKRASRFKPMVKFLGPFRLKKGQTDKHIISLPQYIGSVRTMVVAGNGHAYGNAEKTTPVRKPLMVLATLPRVLGPGETVKLPVTVFAMEDNVKKVQVEVEANDLFVAGGAMKKTVTFEQTGDQVVYFDLKTAERTGIARVSVRVKSGREQSQQDIELDVRNPNPLEVKTLDKVLDPGETWETNYQFPGMQGTNSGLLELSGMPPVDFGRRLKYLINYPHGCIEQTTSAAFPQLYLGEMMSLDAKTKAQTELNVKSAINRIRRFMLSDGGLGYWPGSNEANDWGTSYAGHFMLEAEAHGYALPPNFKRNWTGYQRKAALNWQANRGKYQYEAYYQGDLEQAYRLYTLALAGTAEMGAMNRLREKPSLSVQAKWRLAAAYVLAGQPEVAQDLVDKATMDIKPYKGFYSTFGSRDRDLAMILETLTLMQKRDEAALLMKKISEALSGNQWMSTQTTAYCLLAVSKFAGANATSKEIKFEYALNNQKTTREVSSRPLSRIKLPVEDTTGRVELQNNGEGILFARLTLEGVPLTGRETGAENNLRIKVTYKDMQGHLLDVSSLEQGTDFMAEVTLSNPGVLGYYSDMALTQIFPSGWEITNMRLDQTTAVYEQDKPSYQDIRDDRVYTYFNLPANKQKTFVVLLNAAYAGRFYLPAVSCRAMYEKSISAATPGKWVEVVQGSK